MMIRVDHMPKALQSPVHDRSTVFNPLWVVSCLVNGADASQKQYELRLPSAARTLAATMQTPPMPRPSRLCTSSARQDAPRGSELSATAM